MAKKHDKHTWRQEINDIVRGTCGGFLFGIPLIYTMEIWWIGSLAKPRLLVMAIAFMFIVVFFLNYTEGFRKRKNNWRVDQALIDTVEAMAIGFICSAFMLWLLQEITPQTSLKESLGKVVFTSVSFTLGVALANQLFPEDNQNNSISTNDKGNGISKDPQNDLQATFADLGATLIGAIVIAFNIAPTDEVPMLASAISPPWLLALMAASLVISYAIVFQAGFSDQQKRRQQKGIFQSPLSETTMSYLVSLLASGVMLFFFQKVTFADPWMMWLEHILILGLPATIGGAAGRLAI
ncbi:MULTISPECIES: TIGR02587 family membrane protein [unclassified Nodularia (in: cyanobacteria)]|uniref:TIGR02587 family membrane protein n=1 Tax=unclassified Nodularia (in: cyanobacteria) TaxID=2656917 RepID=UPI00187F5F83|nr:TIGR02587 family membrane protein [Nodularia sp. LEGE 06071]MBE9197607.1 TIGR02587 family membrane protein [Nodularia sp. LEGE 06071]MCC2692112.1 TIGR02587 family membrane protein [Nodularia sp. LEGE 04288]